MLSPIKILLYAPFFLPVADKATEKKCAAKKTFKTDLEVNFYIGKTVYDHKKTVKQISALGSGQLQSWNHKHGGGGLYSTHASGLTQGVVKYQFETQVVSMPTATWGGQQCPYLKKLKVDVTYGSTIYIAKEFEKDGCYFMEVLEHEHKHHNINMKTTGQYVETLRKDLPKVIAYAEKKAIGANGNAAMNKLNKEMQKALEFYNSDMNTKMKTLNEQVDTPEEYERVANACKDGSGPRRTLRLW